MRILITGANGHLGVRLIASLSLNNEVVSVVRSDSALEKISGLNCETHIVDYSDSDGLSAAASGCDCAVHLVGIIKKTGNNTYEQAHELSCEALVYAARMAGLKKIVALSIIGSDVTSSNACLASRGRSENILLDGDLCVAIAARLNHLLQPQLQCGDPLRSNIGLVIQAEEVIQIHRHDGKCQAEHESWKEPDPVGNEEMS